MNPTTIHGLLGWSNKRVGLEFYRWDPKTIPRHDSEWGDLLVDVIRNGMGYDPEGSPVIVVVLPRSTDEEQVLKAHRLVADALTEMKL